MTTTTLTLDTMRTRWLGQMVLGSADHGLDASGRHPRPVTEIRFNREFAQFIAYAGEHHRANSLEALNRRLQSLKA